MAVLLNRPYFGYLQGTVVELPASTEAALIGNGFASATAAAITPGPVTANVMRGTCALAAAAASIVITNSLVDATSIVVAYISQTTADATATSVVRVVPGAGLFTIFVNAAATAATQVDWVVMNSFTQPLN